MQELGGDSRIPPCPKYKNEVPGNHDFVKTQPSKPTKRTMTIPRSLFLIKPTAIVDIMQKLIIYSKFRK